jgi:hypothetical protein
MERLSKIKFIEMLANPFNGPLPPMSNNPSILTNDEAMAYVYMSDAEFEAAVPLYYDGGVIIQDIPGLPRVWETYIKIVKGE